MSLDVKTLFLLTIDVEAILGLLLLFVWMQNTAIRAVAWWGCAHLLRALSVALYGMYGSVTDLITIDLADAILFLSYAVTWSGARVFDGRRPLPGSMLSGATIWLVACQLPGFAAGSNLRLMLSAAIIATFTWLTAYEFWRGREERLVSRWPAIFVLFAHGAVFLLRTPLSAIMQWSTDNTVFASAWLTLISTESLLATISTAFILLAMAKERTELRHKTAAMVDALTGLANRRAFLDDAAQLTRLQVGRDRPVAVFMIDLDRFKSINDQFGHAVGDKVLQVFADTVRANVRSTDLVGRLGGEEFVILLADACRDNAFAVAERLRLAFEATGATVAGHAVNATASIGVSIIQDPDQDLSELIDQADQALYRAKARGRNRTVVTGLGLDMDAPEPDAPAEAANAPVPLFSRAAA